MRVHPDFGWKRSTRIPLGSWLQGFRQIAAELYQALIGRP